MDLNLKLNRILFSILLITLGYSQKVIAVSDITSEGLSKIQTKQVFNKLESQLVKMDIYSVTSRSDVDKILKEMKFQASGCTDQQCAAELGKMLNADFMLLSDILYDNTGNININLKIVEVESAQIIQAISRFETVNKFIEMLDLIPSCLIELVGFGWLTITGTPAESRFILNGKNHQTPFNDYKTDMGKYSITISKNSYVSQAYSFTIIPQQHFKLNYLLEPVNKKLALRKAILFPGSGHYYAENKNFGKIFRYMTLASLLLDAKLFFDYSDAVDQADNAYLEYKDAIIQDVIDSKAQIYIDKSDIMNAKLLQLGVGCGVTAGIWIYNVIHLNNFLSTEYFSNHNSNFNISITPYGMVEANIKF